MVFGVGYLWSSLRFAEAGTLSGTVTLAGHTPGPVVVYVEGEGPAPPAFPLPNYTQVANLTNAQFSPQVLVVGAGATVPFPNRDNVYHNVYLEYGADLINLGTDAPGAQSAHRFDAAAEVDVRCNIHPWMWMTILVIPNAWYDVVTDGVFRIDGVGAGRREVTAWAAGHTPLTMEIDVPVGATMAASVKFRLPRERTTFDQTLDGGPRDPLAF